MKPLVVGDIYEAEHRGPGGRHRNWPDWQVEGCTLLVVVRSERYERGSRTRWTRPSLWVFSEVLATRTVAPDSAMMNGMARESLPCGSGWVWRKVRPDALPRYLGWGWRSVSFDRMLRGEAL